MCVNPPCFGTCVEVKRRAVRPCKVKSNALYSSFVWCSVALTHFIASLYRGESNRRYCFLIAWRFSGCIIIRFGSSGSSIIFKVPRDVIFLFPKITEVWEGGIHMISDAFIPCVFNLLLKFSSSSFSYMCVCHSFCVRQRTQLCF